MPPSPRPPPARSIVRRRQLVYLLFILSATIISSLILLDPSKAPLPKEVINLSKGAKEWLSTNIETYSSLIGGLRTDESEGRGRVGMGDEESFSGWMGKLGKWMGHFGAAKLVEQRECEGWDPEDIIDNDPRGCLKARQYRQVQVAIERESRSFYLSYTMTHDHNLACLHDMLKCFLPVAHPDFKRCPDRPVIISEYPYSAHVWLNNTTGEVIWMESLVKQIQVLGYYILPVGPYGHWVDFAGIMPDVYSVLWAQDIMIITCISDPRCVSPEGYKPPPGSKDLSIGVPEDELGVIPVWRLNVVDYWGSRPLEVSNVDYWWNKTERGTWSFHPLGREWQATPWPLPDGHVHLPYSIEEYCLKLPVKPHEEREDTVLLYAKRSSYFHRPDTPPTLWSDLSRNPQFKVITTAEIDETLKPIPEGLISIGKQQRIEYEKLVGSVKAVVGVGFPGISPSVYTALCQGTPVIVPHFFDTYNLEGWFAYDTHRMQHGPAMLLGEPYVYTYWLQNATELEEVINRASRTPIERYVPHDMTFTYALKAMKAYLTRDLEGMYRTVVKENGGVVPHLYPGIFERSTELHRTGDLIKAGRKKVPPGVYLP